MRIKNLLFQPLSLHLSVDNEGLHMNAREVTDVLEHQVSNEIKLAAARGLVSLIGKVSDGIDHALGSEVSDIPEVSSTDDPGSPVSATDDPQTNQKKGNRK